MWSEGHAFKNIIWNNFHVQWRTAGLRETARWGWRDTAQRQGCAYKERGEGELLDSRVTQSPPAFLAFKVFPLPGTLGNRLKAAGFGRKVPALLPLLSPWQMWAEIAGGVGRQDSAAILTAGH